MSTVSCGCGAQDVPVGLAALCALHVLQQDLRPTLILDLSHRPAYADDCVVLLENAAFRNAPELNLQVLWPLFTRPEAGELQMGRWTIHASRVDVDGAEVWAITASSCASPARTPMEASLSAGVFSLSEAPANSPDASLRAHQLSRSDGSTPRKGPGKENGMRKTRPRKLSRTDSEARFSKLEPDSAVELDHHGNGDRSWDTPTPTPPDTPHASEFPPLPTEQSTASEMQSAHAWRFTRSTQAVPIESWLFPTQSVGHEAQKDGGQHFRNLRAVDWSNSSAGAPETWPTSVRVVANSIMGNPYPTSLYIGPRYCLVYNQAWTYVAQGKDPYILGSDFAQGWPELQEQFLPLLDASFYHGQHTHKENQLLFLQKDGGLQERYFDFGLSPIIGENGFPVAVVEQAFEHTRYVVTARRLRTLRQVANSLGSIRDLYQGNFWKLLLSSFDGNLVDSPLLILYRADPGSDERTQQLQGCVGVAAGSKYAPYQTSLRQTGEMADGAYVDGLHPGGGVFDAEMQLAKDSNSVVVKKLEPAPEGEFIGRQGRGYDDQVHNAAVIPIEAPGRVAQGFLIIGLNTRSPFDEDYRVWLEFVKKELATTASRVQLSKEEIERVLNTEKERNSQRHAAHLKELLNRRTEDLRHSELLFTRTAETIPVGLVLLSAAGYVHFVNAAWREMSGLLEETTEELTDAWKKALYREDRARVSVAYRRAIDTKTPMHLEARLGNGYGAQGWRYWVSISMITQVCEEKGDVTGYLVSIVDVTSIKKNEEYQRQLSTQALERRRQQENFIDMFSHELRNPFSATMQCADGILSAAINHQESGENLDIEDLIDSAQTILMCVGHQIRIIDDVLTLSKLDSMLLSVIPVDFCPHESMRQIMKIFSGELQVKGIRSSFIIDDSYKELQVGWVRADSSRFSQILINLVTNAIKFTSLQTGKRQLTIRLAASRERPETHGNVTYQECSDKDEPEGATSLAECADSEWGCGEPLYVQVAVQDSGIGISKEWQSKLFRRFEQVPKTHVTYGGSGLGLFICRKLCRLQGGGIGVDSEEGRGSTFAFFIKTRRSLNPDPHAPAAGPAALVRATGRILAPSAKERTPTPVFTYDGHRCSISTTSESVSPLNTMATPSQLEEPPVSPVPSPKPPLVAPPSYRVLIVEDNLINQEVLRRQLKKEGCITYVANNGQQALDFICNETIFSQRLRNSHQDHMSREEILPEKELDIVLMDMEMPIMDGNTATREIRKMQIIGLLRGHVPILGISANARPEQVRKMTEAGMDDAISKPFRIKDLIARFGELLWRVRDGPGVSAGGGGGVEGRDPDRRRHTA